jgi:hypothetical protein
VFVSHTSELRDFPKGTPYVAAAERAIIAAGHVPVDMTDFPAADRAPADLCADRVHSCDVYLGILGTRYGSPVRDKPDVSYTELEFGTATDAGLDRLMFLLDTEVGDVGIPLSRLIDRESGQRQDDFRRLRESKLVTRSFASPDTLQLLVERSLRELADTRCRIGSGIQREQVPAEPQPVRSSKFVNPPPAMAPRSTAPNSARCSTACSAVIRCGGVAVSPTIRGAPSCPTTARIGRPHGSRRWWHSSSTSVQGPPACRRAIKARPFGCKRDSTPSGPGLVPGAGTLTRPPSSSSDPAAPSVHRAW